MDEKTRGFIERSLDEVLAEGVISGSVNWIQGEIPIKSLRDVALGYIIGSVERFANTVIMLTEKTEVTLEDQDEIRGIMKRRIPEIMQKILSELGR